MPFLTPHARVLTAILVLILTSVAGADIQTITLASGGGVRPIVRDGATKFALVQPLGSAPIAASDFAAARVGAASYVASSLAPGWGAAIPGTRWVTMAANGSSEGRSALYAASFTIAPDALTDRWTGSVTIEFQADIALGDAARAGLYINEVPIAGSAGGGPGSTTSMTLDIPVGALRAGVNWCYLYVQGPLATVIPGRPSGVNYRASIIARPLSVGPSPTAGYVRISEAVDAAGDGDEIPVLPGVYADTLTLGSKSITLRSTAGAEQTLIRNLDRRDSPLVCYGLLPSNATSGAEVRIEGFTITHTDSTPAYTVYVFGTTAVFRSCRILSNRLSTALAVEGGDHCTHARLENSLVKQFDGATEPLIRVYASAGQNITVSELLVSGCTFVGSGVGGVATTPLAQLYTAEFTARIPTASLHLENCIARGFTPDLFESVIQNQTQTGSLAQQRFTVRSCNLPVPPGPATGFAATWSWLTNPASMGNIDADPLFVDPSAGDYRLAAGSPCIDAGSNALAAGLFDGEGEPGGHARKIGARVDMGAYEFAAATSSACVPDFNHDGNLDPDDLADFITAYFSGCP